MSRAIPQPPPYPPSGPSWSVLEYTLPLPLLSRGWRNRGIHFVRPGWTNLSHAVKKASNVSDITLKKISHHKQVHCVL